MARVGSVGAADPRSYTEVLPLWQTVCPLRVSIGRLSFFACVTVTLNARSILRRVRRSRSQCRWLLTLVVSFSLLQCPVPVVHAHEPTVDGTWVGDWLDGHLERFHPPGSSEAERHWHLVLPSQFADELGGECPELPLSESNQLTVTAPTAACQTVGGSAAESAPVLWNVDPGLPTRSSFVMTEPRRFACEFIASYSAAVPHCALIGIARL